MSTGKTYSTKYLLDSNNNRGAAGQVLSTTSTGIDWVDANTVPGTGLWLANGNDIYNSNSGNVGIGLTSPGAKLEIVDTSNPGATSGSVIIEGRRDGSPNVLTLRAKDASAPAGALPNGQGPVVRFQGFDGTDFENMGYIQVAADGQAVANGDAPSFMAFGTSADGSSSPTEKMRIDSSGNLLLGAGLGNPYLAFLSAGGNGGNERARIFGYADGGTYGGGLKIQTRNDSNIFGTAITIDHDKNVGIGTTGPLSKLDIVLTTGPQLRLTRNAGTEYSTLYSDSAGGLVISSYSSGTSNYQIFSINSSEKVRIINNGNVGIATTSPNAKLEIGSAYGDAIILKDNRTASSGEFEHGIRFSHYNDYANGLYFQHNDYFGIAKDKFLLKVGNSTKMVVDYSGKVGIGTTGPVQKLHIVDTDGANIILNSNTGAENNGIWMTEGGVATPYVNGAYVHYDSTNNIFKINTGAASLATRFEIVRDTGAIKFNSYGAGTLVTDASGNITASSGGGAGGPYLPLSAGTSYPLTDSLFIRGDDKGLVVQNAASTTNVTVGAVSSSAVSTGFITLRHLGVTKIVLNANDNSYFNGGNVGIGVTGPTAPLHISASGADGTAMFKMTASAGTQTFNWASTTLYPNLAVGKTMLHLFGQAGSTNNQAYVGFKYAGSGSTSNMLTLGFFANDFLVNVLANGNVGIGVTGPGNKLSIAEDMGTTFSDAFLGLKATLAATANTKTAISLATSTTNNYGVTLNGIRQEATSGEPRFGINMHNNSSGGTEAFTIRSSGNVGIGTTSPVGKLNINTGLTGITYDMVNQANGSISFSNNSGGTAAPTITGKSNNNLGLMFVSGTNNTGPVADMYFDVRENDNTDYSTLTSSAYRFNRAGNPLMTILRSGNVGIATTSPNDVLEVAGNNSTQHRIRINNAGTGTATLAFTQGTTFKSWVEHNNSTGNFDVWQYTNNPLRFATNNTERIRITSAGDVQIVGNRYLYANPSAGSTTIGAGFQLDAVNNIMKLWTNNTERMRITSGGNVGINNSAPNEKLSVRGNIELVGEGVGNCGVRYIKYNCPDEASYNVLGLTTSTANFITKVGINKTSPSVKLDVSDSIAGSGFTNGLARFENTIETSSGGAGVLNVANNYQGGFGTLIKFWFEESSVASINFNSSTNAVVYNTTSDYRLKEDLKSFNGLEIVDQIKTYNYKWKKADARGYGALAHELQEVFPDAVTGEKDGEDMQGVDYSTLVPVLIKSIQELKAEIELLKQQINN